MDTCTKGAVPDPDPTEVASGETEVARNVDVRDGCVRLGHAPPLWSAFYIADFDLDKCQPDSQRFHTRAEAREWLFDAVLSMRGPATVQCVVAGPDDVTDRFEVKIPRRPLSGQL